MVDAEANRHLAWFLGPRAENADYLEAELLLILRDYIHWRRNYFPSDRLLVSQSVKRTLEDEFDSLSQNVVDMASGLRRNFPFYSPRYIGHQLSDTTLPGVIGYFAGMLYNPNNVTTEAAPVTVDWEIDACNELLKMVGFNEPPEATVLPKAREEFGWAHLTLGGTTANIEALWVARVVRYFPLSVREVAIKEGLEVRIHLPTKTDGFADQVDIREMSESDVILTGLIRPNEAIYLLAYFVEAVRRKFGVSAEEAGKEAWSLLGKSAFGSANGIGTAFHKYPPVIFASGAAHYSVKKAADILGIGRNNVKLVNMDSSFRMDVSDLERQIRYWIRKGRVPLAVVAVAGTTEEGAVDPIHEIVDLRRSLEDSKVGTFWLHVDAAWAGYVRCLFRDADAIKSKISRKLEMEDCISPADWLDGLLARLASLLEERELPESVRSDLLSQRDYFEQIAKGGLHTFVEQVKRFLLKAAREIGGTDPAERLFTNRDFAPTLAERVDLVNNYVQERIDLSFEKYTGHVLASWGSKDVCQAFMAFDRADSITIDPHKMGYIPYPCGALAFKNDRVRHFILQQAPYITGSQQNALVHTPPRHARPARSEDSPSRWSDVEPAIDAFAPFILEGSRPGAAASALWLSIQTIPLTMHAHGSIVRSSLLAARELYEWLTHWDRIMDRNNVDRDFTFIPITPIPPDTNIVLFVVKKRTSSSLSLMNKLTRAVYQEFSIQAELGDREYSYSQPFFLSRTTCQKPEYPTLVLQDFFSRSNTSNAVRDYGREGLEVLRATVMNPYINPMKSVARQNLIQEFMLELSDAARVALPLIASSG